MFEDEEFQPYTYNTEKNINNKWLKKLLKI